MFRTSHDLFIILIENFVGDERFEAGQIIERFSQSDTLEHWVLKSLYPISRHDACVITGTYTDPPTGTVFRASTSVEDNLVPKDTACYLRAKVVLYGWVFRPMFKEEPSGSNQWCAPQTSVRVTFVKKIVYENKLSFAIKRVLDMESLNSILRISNSIKRWGCIPFAVYVRGRILEEEYEPRTGTYHISYVARHDVLEESAFSPSDNKKTTIQICNGGFEVFAVPRDVIVQETNDGRFLVIETTCAMNNKTVCIDLIHRNQYTTVPNRYSGKLQPSSSL
ncbi:hypothetical protein CLU79DRAFT_840985 [Phycomyces nitens]|nr:hypothetical protein CLU79DRAFT_840985 [Phycomyces nitens]